jgi:hypothetical protein
MPKLANGCRLFLPLFENSHGVARTYYYGTAHPSRLGRAGCSGRCRHGSQKFAVALGLVRRLSRSSIASTVESELKALRSTQSGKPVKPPASTGFLEWAMGIELYPKFLSLAETRCYQPLRESIVAKCCQKCECRPVSGLQFAINQLASAARHKRLRCA